jgi:hypothetical protein
MSDYRQDVVYEPSRQAPIRSEEDLFQNLITPQSRTAEEKVFEFDKDENRIKVKSKHLGTPEINLADLTTAILKDGNSTFQYVWHTISLINQEAYEYRNNGNDNKELTRFLYNMLTSNLNVSKSAGGALLKAITTKEMRNITEQHNITHQEQDPPNKLEQWWNRKKEKDY